MSDPKTTDAPDIQFSSTVFPTEEDMALWESLSTDEQRAIVARDEEAGFRSGAAPEESLSERLARVRAASIRAV